MVDLDQQDKQRANELIILKHLGKLGGRSKVEINITTNKDIISPEPPHPLLGHKMGNFFTEVKMVGLVATYNEEEDSITITRPKVVSWKQQVN